MTILLIDFNGNNVTEIGEFEYIKDDKYGFGNDFINNFYYYSNECNIHKIEVNISTHSVVNLLSNEQPLYRPKFQFIDESLQPNSSNRCSSAGCSQLCLPINETNYKCVCSEHKYLCDNRVSFLKLIYNSIFIIIIKYDKC